MLPPPNQPCTTFSAGDGFLLEYFHADASLYRCILIRAKSKSARSNASAFARACFHRRVTIKLNGQSMLGFWLPLASREAMGFTLQPDALDRSYRSFANDSLS